MMWVPKELVPEWERQWPGLLDWELDRLGERASNIQINDDQLKEGLLVVDFDWPFEGASLRLRATFPGGYPFLRPHVQLLTDPETWPDRHVSPIDGMVCLLGRDSAQWTPDWYLVKLLDQQLKDALLGTGDEDPQGEPADFWWNSLAPLPDSYLLVDSAWDLGEAEGGRFDITYSIGDKSERQEGDPLLPFRAVVSAVRSNDGSIIAKWQGPLPRELGERSGKMAIPWVRSHTTLMPRPKSKVRALLSELRTESFGSLGHPHKIAKELFVRAFAVVHPVEVVHKKYGLGWIVGGEWGTKKEIERKPGTGHLAPLRFIPVMRAGESDLQVRVPAVGVLRQKRIAVIGLGAIGSPIAIELARNGCAELRLVDHDSVEPGNSIRWPLGAQAWGRPKVVALLKFIRDQYPGVNVTSFVHHLGGLGLTSDDALLQKVFQDIDLVVDAAVSEGVSRLLWDRCNRLGLPLIKAGATPTLGGGTVARYIKGGGCPNCLQYARELRGFPKPPGTDATDSLKQPPGCSERTFQGADYDLQELSLQAVRLVVDTVSGKGASGSLIQSLSLVNESGDSMLPSWQQRELEEQPECCGKVALSA